MEKKKRTRARVGEGEGNPGKIGWTFLHKSMSYVVIIIITGYVVCLLTTLGNLVRVRFLYEPVVGTHISICTAAAGKYKTELKKITK